MIYQVAIRSGFTDAQYFSRRLQAGDGPDAVPIQRESAIANPSKA